MRHCKEAVVKPLSITKAYGYINEWGVSYAEKFRHRNALFIGSADTTVCALIMRMPNGISEAYCLFHHWTEGEDKHLNFFTSVASCINLEKQDAPKWFFDGEQVELKELAKTSNEEAAQRARMVVSGLPALACLAYKSYLINEAFRSPKFWVNEPILMVPKSCGKVDIALNVVESFLSFICSGMGGLMSPAYLRTRELVHSYAITPWQMYLNAGCDPKIMMSDFGKKQGMLGKLIKVVSDTIEQPIEMLGVNQRSLPLLLSPIQIKAFKDCVPWFVMDVDGYVVPQHKDCFLMGRRMDTFQTQHKSHIAARQLGFEIPNIEELRQQTRSAETPNQKAPLVVELKTPAQITPVVELESSKT